MNNATPTRSPHASTPSALRVDDAVKRPQLLGSLLVLNLIIAILLISGMRGLLA